MQEIPSTKSITEGLYFSDGLRMKMTLKTAWEKVKVYLLTEARIVEGFKGAVYIAIILQIIQTILFYFGRWPFKITERGLWIGNFQAIVLWVLIYQGVRYLYYTKWAKP